MNEELREQILDCLHLHGQAVTYGALAGLVDADAEFVMNDLNKNERNSWVVSERDKVPTGYEPEMIDNRLLTESSMNNIINETSPPKLNKPVFKP